MWNKWEMIHWQREQTPVKWRGNGGEEHRNCDGDCIKSNIERGGTELNIDIDRTGDC